jgi:hypothetical protein
MGRGNISPQDISPRAMNYIVAAVVEPQPHCAEQEKAQEAEQTYSAQGRHPMNCYRPFKISNHVAAVEMYIMTLRQEIIDQLKDILILPPLPFAFYDHKSDTHNSFLTTQTQRAQRKI